jgi:thiol-disulfide isomerase/thioredoxin
MVRNGARVMPRRSLDSADAQAAVRCEVPTACLDTSGSAVPVDEQLSWLQFRYPLWMRWWIWGPIALAFSCAAPTGKGPLLLGYTIEKANEQHLPLVVEFNATWCKPCRVFAEQVLTDPRVTEALRDVMFVQYDIDTPAGADASHRCKVHTVPVVVGIDHDGFVRLIKRGTEPTADEFLEFLRQAKTRLGTH